MSENSAKILRNRLQKNLEGILDFDGSGFAFRTNKESIVKCGETFQG